MSERKTFKIYIEIPVLLMNIAISLSDSIKTNLIIFRTCYVTLGYNKSDCALLGSKIITNATANLETLTEPSAATIMMVQDTIKSLIFAISCLFLGPWTDRFGRKPILILPVIGFMAKHILFVIFALIENASPWYILLCALPVLLTGGSPTYATVIFCYITDVTGKTNRGMRMSLFEAAAAIGVLLGSLSSSYILAATNYATVFAISAFCCFLIIIFTVFFMPESLQTQPVTQGRFRGLFRISHLSDMLKTTFKKRPNYGRFLVLSSVFALSLFVLAHHGESGLKFFFLRVKFNWSLEQFTIFNAANHVFWLSGTVLGTYFLHKKFKISETVMILIGFISLFIGTVYFGFAKYNWDIYFASVIGFVGGVVKPMVRSLISKIVSNEEVGKIFPLVAVGDLLIGRGGAAIFTAIYNATINIDPGIIFFVSAGILLFEIIIAMVIIFAKISSQPINCNTMMEDERRNDMIT